MKTNEKEFIRIVRQLMVIASFAFLIVATSCSDDDDPIETQQDIVDLAVANGYDVLAAALTEANLVTTLKGTGPFTVFAPTNEAFAAAGITASNVGSLPTEDLSAILQYHVIPARVTSQQLTSGAVASVEGSDLIIDAENLTVNGVDIINPFDVEGSNGVIHTIGTVLELPEEEVEGPSEDIVTLAQGNSDLSILVTALTKYPDLVETLSGEGSFTVFAPNNAAFTALLGVIGQDELEDIPEAVLRRVLEYHVVAGTSALSTALTDGQEIGTVLSETDIVTIGKTETTVTVNQATVIGADVGATNGVVHVIDAVLVPELESSIVNTVVEPAYFNVNYTTLTTAVIEAGLLEALTDREATYTVFAPNNDAFDALLTELDISAEELLASEDLADILLYHILDVSVTSSELTTSLVETLQGTQISIDASAVTVNDVNIIAPLDIAAENGVVHTIEEVLTIPTVVDVAVANDFTILAEALTAAGLIETLEGAGPFTVFAPTDEAFAQLLTDLQITKEDLLASPDLSDILLYHVLPGVITSSELTSGLFETAQGVQMSIDAGALTVNEAGITAPFDLLASNGVIHGIDEVLLVPNLAEVATANEFSILVEAVVAAGLVDAITADDADLTIFAPTNTAFEALLTDLQITKADLLARQDLADILLYHIVDGVVTSDMLSDSTVPTLLDGQSLTVSATNLTINDANLEIELIDVLASNGVIHGIDQVLLPPAN